MDKHSIAVLAAIGLSGLAVYADYHLKIASQSARPLLTPAFMAALLINAATLFAWVFVMQRMKLATIGAVYSVSMAVMLTLLGVLFFGERLSRMEVTGVVLAIASLAILSRFA